MKRWMLPLVLAASLMGGVSVQAATAPAADTNKSTSASMQKVRFASVMVNKKELLRLADTPDRRANERAQEVQKRLRMTLVPEKGQAPKPIQDSEVTVQTVTGEPVIRFRNQNVIDVTKQDAALNGHPQQQLAQRWASDLRTSLKGIKIAKGKPLPAGLIAISTGQMDVPKTATMGGGGGGKPKHKKPQK